MWWRLQSGGLAGKRVSSWGSGLGVHPSSATCQLCGCGQVNEPLWPISWCHIQPSTWGLQ